MPWSGVKAMQLNDSLAYAHTHTHSHTHTHTQIHTHTHTHKPWWQNWSLALWTLFPSKGSIVVFIEYIQVDEPQINLSTSVIDLRLVIHEYLDMTAHISNVIKSCYCHLWSLGKTLAFSDSRCSKYHCSVSHRVQAGLLSTALCGAL